ncbi:hypothetical protein AMK59_3472 [Oryctes borbonicus]|uniref:Uncharacterized protein n=1 Tax=Oryctes borbonicus TaxID=1629725 RepID=A0A0T6B8L7_9SCAR|nr:hypothetical protein AMK59_3472 [Oryctes borbonicus]
MLHLILTIFCAVLIGKTLSDDVTPFCKFCACTNAPHNPDVDCSSSIIRSALYNKELWFNEESNSSYSISSLSLQNSDLTVLNETFPETNLKVLDLSFNRITNISNGVFVNIEDMEELILSNNKLQNIGPDVFRGLRLEGFDYPLRSLRILRLDYNELHTLNPDVFQHVDRDIKVLSLSHNPFKVLDQQTVIAITSIVTLEELDISYTELKDLPQYFLHTPQYLKKLDLSGNQMTKIPETLEDAHVLEELVMDGNPIANLTKEA